MKKASSWIIGIIAGFCMILALLISSFEIVTYSTIGFYKHEYTKYKVDETLNMQMEDVLSVTKQMMAYLRGNRPDLVVQTTVGGQPREFFNDQEKSHMADVRNLFLGGLLLRYICLGIAVVFILALIFLRRRKWKYVLAKSFQISTLIFVLLSALLGVFVAVDFYDVFVIFHKIFFTNNLWLFDPNTSLMINMLPEGFFFDTVKYIGIVFGGFLLLLLILSILASRFFKEDESIRVDRILPIE